MSCVASLSYTSNVKYQEFMGCVGCLERNSRGGFDFLLRDNGLLISTSPVEQMSLLERSSCGKGHYLDFETKSGSVYQFMFAEPEKAVDVTFPFCVSSVDDIVSSAEVRAGAVYSGSMNKAVYREF